MLFQKNFIEHLKNMFLPSRLILEGEDLAVYSKDQTEDLVFMPDVVVKPESVEEVSAVLRLCNDYKVPVTVRGAGTGLAGGALAVEGGLVLSMERFNKILDIDEKNLQVTTEPGVITEALQNAVKEKGLFYPPDPASKGSCFIGGNVSHNSGGPKAVKYGVVKDYVLNLQVVLANGEVIWTGANTLKNATGYNLTQLMVGSEGTLGVVTKIVLKLIPHPTHTLLMLAPFPSAEKACGAVGEVFRAGITPSAMEFIEKNALKWALEYVEEAPVSVKENEEAYLLIEVDGNNPEHLLLDCEKISMVLEEFEAGEILFADSEAQKEALWKVRRSINPSIHAFSYKKELDTVVPRAKLPEQLRKIKAIGKKYGIETVCFGHAGDGNLHVNIVKKGLTDEQWQYDVPKATREMFEVVHELGGRISGEHGIGYVQKPYMDIMFSEVHLDLMRGIKKVFDPNGILNPKKIFD
jgi:glycolate oxidase